MIKKEMRYFLKGLTDITKNIIKQCLELICFDMSSNLIYFDWYY